MTKDEQETIVNISAMDDYAEIYSGILPFVRRLRKWASEGLCEVMFDHEEDIKVHVPLNNLSILIRKPRARVQLTPEQLEAARERMTLMRHAKGAKNV